MWSMHDAQLLEENLETQLVKKSRKSLWYDFSASDATHLLTVSITDNCLEASLRERSKNSLAGFLTRSSR